MRTTDVRLQRRGTLKSQTHAERRKEGTALGGPMGQAEYVISFYVRRMHE